MYLTKSDIINIFSDLANSQGFYGRLLRDIREAGEEGEAYLEFLESRKFRDALDLILYVEG